MNTEDKLNLVKSFHQKNKIIKWQGVDLVSLSKELGIKQITINSNLNADVLGGITKADGHYYIVINNVQEEKRKRFTIAHELGHFILHQEILDKKETILDKVGESNATVLLRQTDAEGTSITNKEEIEANKMAADILMPFDKIREVMTSKGGDNNNRPDVSYLADYFNVSLTAMAYRLEKNPNEKFEDLKDWYL